MRTRAGLVILVVAAIQCALLVGTLALLTWRLDATRDELLRSGEEEASLMRDVNALEADVLRVAILTRDTLLLSGAAREGVQQTMEETIARMRGALRPRRAGLTPELRQRFADVEAALDDYLDRSMELAQWSEQDRRQEGPRFVAEELTPRRRAIRQSTGEIAALITAIRNQARQANAASVEALRASMLKLIGAVVLLSVALAGFALARVAGYEAERTRHLARLSAAETRLRTLSQHQLELQEAERKVISRELHDQVGQLLTALRMRIGQIRPIDGAGRQEASEATALADRALRSVRDMARSLRPAILDDLGLVPALRSLVRDFSRGSAIDFALRFPDGLPDLSEAHRTCIYRIVQEAVTNCMKHAGASRVEIELRHPEGAIEAVIRDDGRGMPAPGFQGIGILGMQERAAELGGSLEVVSSPGGGTTVTTRLPCAAARPEKELRTA